MKRKTITSKIVEQFEKHLKMEEKSKNTVEKYIRDVTAFAKHLDGKAVSKELAIAYKQHLQDSGYAVRSINSIIASINALFGFMGLHDCNEAFIDIALDHGLASPDTADKAYCQALRKTREKLTKIHIKQPSE